MRFFKKKSDNMTGNMSRALLATVAVSTAVVQILGNVKKIIPRRRKGKSEEE
tara:strand:+ start:923 stop:1078 length:156 start_codon:yes stop_codon:yes gene_type:complete